MNDNVEFKKLLADIREISKISDRDNSILFDFSKRDDSMVSRISILENNGTSKEELSTAKFDITNKFQSFITPVLDEFIKGNEIALNDFVDVNGDNIVTYRLITYNNDQLTVDGLTFDDGFFIKNYVDSKNIKNNDSPKTLTLNNKGMMSTYILIAIITVLSIIIGLLVYFE